MRRCTLLVSRHINLFPQIITFFEGLGYYDLHITEKDKDGLDMLIRELNPRYVFIESCFYSICTPFMVGVLHETHDKVTINVVTTDDFPDETAFWFILHGAKSYVNLLDGVEEFKNGLFQIRNGEEYWSPGVKHILDSNDEWPTCKTKVSRREKEVLEMVCHGLTMEEMGDKLHVCPFTIKQHMKNLRAIFHVNTREELAMVAICLDIVSKKQLNYAVNRKLIASLPDWAKKQIEVNNLPKTRRFNYVG